MSQAPEKTGAAPNAPIIVEPPAEEGKTSHSGKNFTLQNAAKGSGTQSTWKSLMPNHGPAFTGALTPGATTPGASTPDVISFDEPFDESALASVNTALWSKMDHVHDGGLEGAFHHGDDDHHDEQESSKTA